MEHLSRLDEGSQQRGYLCHFAEAAEQGQQVLPVLPVLFQRIRKGHMGHFPFTVFCRIRSQKSKWLIIFVPVLDKMKKHPLRDPQILRVFRKEERYAPLVFLYGLSINLSQLHKLKGNPCPADILRPDSKRHAADDGLVILI